MFNDKQKMFLKNSSILTISTPLVSSLKEILESEDRSRYGKNGSRREVFEARLCKGLGTEVGDVQF